MMPELPAVPPVTLWAVRLLGFIVGLIGLTLLVGGVWLITLGGSWYYALAGFALLVAGIYIAMRRSVGVWLYFATVVLTLFWAFWEVGTDGWALVPRVIAPLVLLVPVLAALPAMGPRAYGWRGTWGVIGGLALISLLAGVLIAAGGTPAVSRIVPPATGGPMTEPAPLQPGTDWPAYGGSTSARRYSPLDQINRGNVGQLRRAWHIHTGDLPRTAFARGKYGAETTPIKVGDSLYLCTPKDIVLALDPATGKTRWRYDPQVPDAYIPYTAACRGVAYYAVPDAAADTPCATRILVGTLDARLIALDARSGTPCADFGTAGQVDTSANMGPIVPGMVSITAAPTIVRGVVVIGHQILDGQKRNAPSGVIKGFDAVTGALRWAWDMTQPDLPVPPPADVIYKRGTPNMWTTATGDDDLGYVYLPLGSAAVDYWSSDRTPAENAFATSLTALDVTTGKPVWSFQTVHNDVWDYDLGSQATLVDFPGPVGPVPALVLPSKQGDLYILDRRTGQPLSGVRERPVPQGGVEPEARAPTQPFSHYHSLRQPPLTEASMWGMSPVDQMICRIQFRQAHYEGFYTPPTTRTRYIQYPGYNGGSDWGGVAVDPHRRVIIANYNDMPNYNRLIPRAEADRRGWAPRSDARGGDLGESHKGGGDPQAGTPYAIAINAGWRLPLTNLLCKQPPYGGIRAIDLTNGETLWDRPLGEALRNGPFGIPAMLPVTIGTPNNGGALVTAGGVIFIAAATDDLIRAIDIETGKTLWQDALPAGGQATPMTYSIGGRQYVVIMAGGHHFMETPIGDSLIAYALPR